MKNFTLSMSYLTLLLLLSFYTSNAQVGIGNSAPDPSAMLDITSTNSGLLTPRMTTTQRLAIVAPADGLIVYDTSLKFFFHYNSATSSWIRISSDSNGRLNFKRIKSTDVLATVLASEKAAGGGSKYLLDSATLYEINGTINLDLPIELNSAYVVGLDTNEDRLIRASGDLFVGVTGGSIRNVTLVATGGMVFNLNGASSPTLVLRDSVVASSTSVGTITNFGLVFISIVQYSANLTGIIYSNISRLYINNAGWLANNNGIFEKMNGTFGIILKQGGFCEVNGSAVGVDVSGNPTISGEAVMESVVFTGTNSNGFINPYSPANTYLGYNFNNKWSVSCSGIPIETDSQATGNLYFDSAPIINVTNTTPFKLPVNTNSIRLFRTAEGLAADSENRLVYKGERNRAVNVLASLSFTATQGSRYDFSIYKNGVKVVGSDVIADVSVTNARQSVSIVATVNVVKNDYLEIYVQKVTTPNEQFLCTSYNLICN